MAVVIYAKHKTDKTAQILNCNLAIDSSKPYGVFKTVAHAKEEIEIEQWTCFPDIGYSYQFIQFSPIKDVKITGTPRTILRKKAI